MSKLRIRGYTDAPSLAPGEAVRVYVSSDDPGSYQAQLVKLINGDPNPLGPGPNEELISNPINGEYPDRQQRTQAGGYVEVPDPDNTLGFTKSFTVHAFISAMLPNR